jgi:hypothetical protein
MYLNYYTCLVTNYSPPFYTVLCCPILIRTPQCDTIDLSEKLVQYDRACINMLVLFVLWSLQALSIDAQDRGKISKILN